MSTTTNEQEAATPQEPQEGAGDEQTSKTPAPDGSGAGDPAAGQEEGAGESQEDKPNDFDSLPPWAQEQIRSLRGENATRRTAEKDLRAKLDEAKSQEDIDAAVNEYKDRNSALERELAFTKHTSDLPENLRVLVKGDTEDEIKEAAEAVRNAFSTHQNTVGDANGGLHPGSEGTGDRTPRELAREALESKRRR